MTWAPDPSLPSLVARLLGRRRETLARQVETRRKAIAGGLSSRGLTGSGYFITQITAAYTDAFQEYALGTTEDLLGLVRNADGSLEPEAAEWVRGQLEANFDATAHGIAQAISESARTEVKPDVGEGIRMAVAAVKRDLSITLDQAVLRRARSAERAVIVDPALLDTLVPLGNRRAFDDEVPQLLSAAKAAGEPVALARFDIDHFKKVNDEHGGHATGDEALEGVAERAAGCVRGKGTAYRIGGDEFALVLPNHTVQEAIAVAERLRAPVNNNVLTSRLLTLSVSVGIAMFPEHGSGLETVSKAADRAAYDAKQLGRNLVRVYGEPQPVQGSREPERRQPEPGGLTEEERQKIRHDYFRRGVATCPRDEARLDVEDTTSLGQKTKSIYVSCPMCGLSEELD